MDETLKQINQFLQIANKENLQSRSFCNVTMYQESCPKARHKNWKWSLVIQKSIADEYYNTIESAHD